MIQTEKTDYAADLTRSGLKNTKQRVAILGILDCGDQPVSAEDVFLELKKGGIPANLSTVYRTLEALSEKKLAVKLNIPGDARALFEYNRNVHKHYLICLGCKKIISINNCPLGDYEKALAEETNFSISGHRLSIYGYCPECQKKRV